jgi:peptide/nickel transport system substrate-binding protein
MTNDLNSYVVAHCISDALVWTGPGGTYLPALATSWEPIDDTTWRFNLREGVSFTNGEPFNAEVVKYTVERIKDPELNSPAQPLMTGRVQEVQVVDEYTVDFVTTVPYPGLPYDFTTMSMVPPEYTQEVSVEEYGRNPIGLGAMKFVEWVSGDHITLEANPDYWGGKPDFDKMIIRFISDEATALAALQAGEIDFMFNLSPENSDTVENSPNAHVQGADGVRQVYLAMDALNPPFDDVRVRQAMNYAVDVPALQDALLEGTGARIVGAFWPSTVGFDSSITPYPYDPEKARALLAEAGYPDGFSTQLHNTPAGEGIINTLDLSEAIQGFFADVGVNAEIALHENAEFWRMYHAQEFKDGMYIASWGAGQAEGGHLMTLFHSSTRGYYYQDPEADVLVEACTSTVERQAREDACAELQAFLQEEAPWIFLYAQPRLYGISDRVNWTGTAEARLIHPIEFKLNQ